ncbi:MAG: amidase [Betaproteobacteria bacterium]|nr:amidase [Betaproteobacteria bacterium]
MNEEDLCFTPATQLAKLIRTKALSPVEIMSTVIKRARRLNGHLNAICTDTYDSALEQARAAETAVLRGDELGLLHGIPVTIKDLSLTKGVRSMGGSFVHRERVPDIDHLHVERLRLAGAISIGKTAVSEFGWSGVSRSPVTGITHNPWKHGMNAGASSAGAGVCAAAGIGPIHQGSDGAGSVRMPAAFCGVFGMKPSFGRIPYHPMPNNGLISHVGPITRTVGDGALMLAATAGPDDRDPWSLEAPPEDYVGKLDAGITGLKIAYSPGLGFLRVDPEVRDSVAHAARAFEEMGCRVEEADPGWGNTMALEHCLFAGAFAGQVGHLIEQWEHKMDPGMVAMAREGLRYTAAGYCRAQGERLALWDRVHGFFQRYDLLLTPSVSVAAFPATRLIPEHWEQHPWDWLRWAGFSYPFNLTGQPAATCPCGFTLEGLPVGIQIVGRRFQDLTVLQAARAFEQARPWASHRPPLG